MPRPVVAVPTYLEQTRFGAWDQPSHVLPRMYADAVQRAEGLALLVPPDAALVGAPDELLDRVDALLLSGGRDLDPELYGARRAPGTDVPDAERDACEVALARRAVQRDLPLLGVCRGMQVLAVAGGGTLHQHLPDVVGHDDHRRTLGTFDGNDHEVRLVPGSLAARAAGEELHATKSHHHQGIDRMPDGWEATGHATRDGLVEAIERGDRRFCLGVQWHPEADELSRVIGALVAAARAGSGPRVA